jgi:hypothetical protein
MATFTFDTPALFGPPAASGFRQKRLLCWLRDRLAPRGVAAFGPVADASGWLLAVNAEDGLVTIRLGRERGGKTCAVIVDKLGEADAEYEDTVAACEDALGGGRGRALVGCDLSA